VASERAVFPTECKKRKLNSLQAVKHLQKPLAKLPAPEGIHAGLLPAPTTGSPSKETTQEIVAAAQDENEEEEEEGGADKAMQAATAAALVLLESFRCTAHHKKKDLL
jgi:hypothetical protein